MDYVLRCACGWETRGSEDEVVTAAKEHGLEVHNMRVTHEEAMQMAEEAPAS